MIFFTADEHYGHTNVIKYCNRPFETIKEMDETLIKNHNQIVLSSDTTYHLGDFSWYDKKRTYAIIPLLNGNHIFLTGDHDKWNSKNKQIITTKYNKQPIVLCHYAIAVWPRSHYNSWHLYGHSHGNFQNTGKSYDVGVDNNNYYPVSLDTIIEIMDNKPNNPNYIGDKK